MKVKSPEIFHLFLQFTRIQNFKGIIVRLSLLSLKFSVTTTLRICITIFIIHGA